MLRTSIRCSIRDEDFKFVRTFGCAHEISPNWLPMPPLFLPTELRVSEVRYKAFVPPETLNISGGACLHNYRATIAQHVKFSETN